MASKLKTCDKIYIFDAIIPMEMDHFLHICNL